MRKKLFYIFTLILVMVTGCTQSHRNLVEKDFLLIRAGMTSSEVEKRLGKPNKIIKDNSKVKDLIENDSEYSTDRWSEEYPDFYYKFYGNKKKAKEYYYLRKESTHMICYEYNYKYKKSSKEIEKWHIYFLDDKVIGMYFP